MSEQDNDKDNDYVCAFDHFYTTNHIQILKSMLPFIDNDRLSMLPVMIKYMELQYTISLMKEGRRPCVQTINACSKENPDLEQIYHIIKKYLNASEKQRMQQIINMSNTISNFKEMQQMMELFQSMNTDSASSDSDNGFSMPNPAMLEDIMKSNPNFEEMAQLFKTMNSFSEPHND